MKIKALEKTAGIERDGQALDFLRGLQKLLTEVQSEAARLESELSGRRGIGGNPRVLELQEARSRIEARDAGSSAGQNRAGTA